MSFNFSFLLLVLFFYRELCLIVWTSLKTLQCLIKWKRSFIKCLVLVTWLTIFLHEFHLVFSVRSSRRNGASWSKIYRIGDSWSTRYRNGERRKRNGGKRGNSLKQIFKQEIMKSLNEPFAKHKIFLNDSFSHRIQIQ